VMLSVHDDIAADGIRSYRASSAAVPEATAGSGLGLGSEAGARAGGIDAVRSSPAADAVIGGCAGGERDTAAAARDGSGDTSR